MSEVAEMCRICRSTGPHRLLAVREMYYGTRETFEYFVCAKCDTLQILNGLEGEELIRHYPRKYYSYNVNGQPRVFQWLTAQLDSHVLGTGGGLFGAFVAALPPGIRSLIGTRDASGDVVHMLAQLGVDRDARVLDVGCGGGNLLDRLAKVGFTKLSGADPFNEADTQSPSGVPIAKKFIDEVNGEFDVVMFNHSLEHVPDPVATLKAARQKLAPAGICLVRLPTTSSEAWTVYQQDWCLIDAPRHFFVPSMRGMELAADTAGLRVEKVWFDSNSSQFFGSECYQRDIALVDVRGTRHLLQLYGLKKILSWERQSKRLNLQNRGDQAGFALRAVPQ